MLTQLCLHSLPYVLHFMCQISRLACCCILCCIIHHLSRLLTLRNLLLPAGHQWGSPPDRGAESRHLDASGVYPRHGGQHWCQLCRHLQGQRPLPVSVPAFPTAFAFSCANCLCLLPVPIANASARAFPHCLCRSLLLVPFPFTSCTNPVQSADITHHDCPSSSCAGRMSS